MATDRLFNQTQGDSLLSILAQIRDGYNSVDGAFSLMSENPIQNKKITGAVTDTIETLGGTAQKSYTIGQYFLANDGYYYVATAAITAGSSNISSSTGGNCSKTCITAAMNNLSSQISNLNNNIGVVSNQLNSIKDSGSLLDIVRSGIYYVTSNVADIPLGHGGAYYYRSYNDVIGVGIGIYIPLYGDNDSIYIYEREDGGLTGVRQIGYQKIFETEVARTTSSTGAIDLYGLLPAGSEIIGLNYTDTHVGLIYQRDQNYLTCLNSAMKPIVNESVTFRVRYYRHL